MTGPCVVQRWLAHTHTCDCCSRSRSGTALKLITFSLTVQLCGIVAAHGQVHLGSTAKGSQASPGPKLIQGQTPDPSNPGYAVGRPTFVLFGDSITEFGHNGPSGWATLLSAYYIRKADIINRGLSGWNTRWALQVLPTTLQQLKPAIDMLCTAAVSNKPIGSGRNSSNTSYATESSSSEHTGSTQAYAWCPRLQLLIIWFGANDAVLPTGKDGFQHVPIVEYKSNLVKMVAAARQAGVAHILLITPPPVDEAMHAMLANTTSSDRTNAQLSRYAAAVKAVGAEQGVPVLDMNSKVSSLPAAQRAGWSYDGVHPGPAGQQMAFESIRDMLETNKAFGNLRRSLLPMHWPLYNDVDYKQPRTTFKRLFDQNWVVPDSELQQLT